MSPPNSETEEDALDESGLPWTADGLNEWQPMMAAVPDSEGATTLWNVFIGCSLPLEEDAKSCTSVSTAPETPTPPSKMPMENGLQWDEDDHFSACDSCDGSSSNTDILDEPE